MQCEQDFAFLNFINKPLFGPFSRDNIGVLHKGYAAIYSRASRILELLNKNINLSLNSLLDLTQPNSHEIARLVKLVNERDHEIKYILNKIEIHRFEHISLFIWKVLIAEMLWGKQYLRNVNIDVQTVKFHEETIRETFLEVINVIDNPIDQDKCKFPTYIRINRIAISVEDAVNAFYKEGWSFLPRSKSYINYLQDLANLGSKTFIPDYHISELLAFPPGTSFHDHPGFLNGKFLIHDKGSSLSSFLLNPKPNSIVLDLAAAPGLKTNHLANMMNNIGTLYANDANPSRVKILHQLLDRTNVSCGLISQENYFKLPLNKEVIEYVLIDPPSSYSGIFLLADKEPIQRLLDYNHFRLSTLLKYTLLKFHNAKRVVYTVCSIYPEEGEKVVDSALKDIGQSYTLVDARQMLWHEWKSVSHSEYKCSGKCIRICPELDQCQGWFIAVFDRNFDEPLPPFKFTPDKVFLDDLDSNTIEKNDISFSKYSEHHQIHQPYKLQSDNGSQQNLILKNSLSQAVSNDGNLLTLINKKRAKKKNKSQVKKRKLENSNTQVITLS